MGSSGSCGDLSDRSVSSKRKKKSSTSDKPRQPQRGMGVAQLEKIRLQDEFLAAAHGNHVLPLDVPMLTGFIKEDIRGAETQFSQRQQFSSYTVPASTSMYAQPHSYMMGFGDSDRRDVAYTSHLLPYTAGSRVASQNTRYSSRQTDYCQPSSSETLSLLKQPSEESAENRWQHSGCDSMGSSSRDSDASNSHELDLELKLSL